MIANYWPVIVGTKSLITNTNWPQGPAFVGDPTAGGPITQPMERAVTHAWAHLHLPLILPYQGYGLNLAGNQGSPWFFPEILIHLLFPSNPSLWLILCLNLCAIGTYLLCREFDLGRLPSALGALLVCMSGPIVSNLNLDMFNPFMDSLFLVLAISRVIRARGNRRVGWLLILAFLVSQLFLSGFDEVVPLLAIMIFFFMIALLTKNGYKLRHSMGLVTAIIISCILGLVGSAIATASLYGAISTSAALQSPNGWKHHSPISWLVTLVDPWFFGKGVIGGIYQGTFAEWAWGNPILWSLAALGTVAIIKDLVLSRGKYQLWHRIILGFALFGFLADFNFAYVDALFSLPILRLIALPRFLPFMWWLPLVALAAIGFEAIRSATQLVRVCGFIFPLLFYVALDLFIHVQGSRAFPVLTAPVVAAFSSQFIFYIFCLVGLVIVVLFDRLAWSEISLAGLVVVSRSLFTFLGIFFRLLRPWRCQRLSRESSRAPNFHMQFF
ncbi:hypothetical protein AXFE_27730 [Acidithrix ferrooxidans]|uniref:Uncharacterized protein n=2 Tax=Acidithrix ferrooxidans TaxID=1280514 RepID=A0A0D8HET1_9ACTN|nr:hypothetical protein AXFE_27730 [Acidithrix ferrooxidans]